MRHNIKKAMKTIMLALALSGSITHIAAGSTIETEISPPATFSESIVVMDAETGVILYDKNGDEEYMPASTTKVMTAILALEMLELDQMVTVGAKPPYAEGASMGFKEGEEVMVIDLIYALMLHSANDAAEILAEAVSGSTEEFAKLMTERAHKIGAVNTIFKNPSGLHVEGDNNYTTSRDLAIITAEAGKNEKLLEISKTRSHMLPLTNLVTDMNRWATNKNSLMRPSSEYYYEPVILGKTGWTPSAGYAHTAMAEQNGRKIVVSILKGVNQSTYWTETRELMEWAFQNTSVHVLYKKGQEMKKIVLPNGEEQTLVAKEDFNYISADPDESPKPVLEFGDKEITEGYVSGDTVDTVKVLLDEKEIGTIELVCKNDIVYTEAELEENAFLDETQGKSIIGKLFSLILGIIAVFGLLVLGFRILHMSKRRKRRRMSNKRLEYLKRIENSRS